jgi:hypothetical protein
MLICPVPKKPRKVGWGCLGFWGRQAWSRIFQFADQSSYYFVAGAWKGSVILTGETVFLINSPSLTPSLSLGDSPCPTTSVWITYTSIIPCKSTAFKAGQQKSLIHMCQYSTTVSTSGFKLKPPKSQGHCPMSR